MPVETFILKNCHSLSRRYTRLMKSISINLGIGAVAIVLLSGCNREAAPVSAESIVATNAPAAATASSRNYDKLKGKWERPDGGYVVEVRSIDTEGKMDAGYFNPSPIKVSIARAYQEGGDIKVFIELRDENYPGCTYKLAYDAKSDQLFGQYYQASMQQTYDVAFGRLKE